MLEFLKSRTNRRRFGARIHRAFVRHGPLGFLRLLWLNASAYFGGEASDFRYVHDDRFDRALGVDTSGVLEIDEMEIASATAPPAETIRYEPVDPAWFEALLRTIEDRREPGEIFIDIGSGKGRALLLAAQHGFSRCVGIEFDKQLHRTAEHNVAVTDQRFSDTTFELHNINAFDYDFPALPTICFFNRPFTGAYLDDFIDKIEASLNAQPRAFILLYLHSIGESVLEEHSRWRLLNKGIFESSRHPFAIFAWNEERG